MSVDVERRGAVAIVNITGDFDLRAAHQPYDAVSPMLDAHEISEIVVDLRAVDFVDSTGLGGLIRLKHEADRHGVALRLQGLGHRLRNLFSITGLDREFTVEEAPTDS